MEHALINYKKRLFIRFLKENNIYAPYRKNFGLEYTKMWNKDGYKRIIEENLDYYSVTHPRLYIDNAFTWSRTIEKHDFWMIFSHKWKKLIRY